MDLACSNIQQCHYLLAQGKVGEARERAVSAAREVAPLIDAEPRARVLAGFALSLVERIDQKKGRRALAFRKSQLAHIKHPWCFVVSNSHFWAVQNLGNKIDRLCTTCCQRARA